MFVYEITLPLIGTLHLPFVLVAPLVCSFVFLSVLFIAITLDNRKEGN